ncbi:MAG: c-type cytochrome, partial [Pirellulales bacterium]
ALRRTSGRRDLGDDPRAWTDWLVAAYPQAAARLGGGDGVDLDAWRRRLAAVDWSAGDAGRGAELYERIACAGCHSAARALGPDLRGVAARFSRDDLFTAIVAPSRDVSPRYQTTLIATGDGKLYQGMIVYEAVDGLLLQTGLDETVRIGGEQVAARRVTQASLMPAGLLDSLSDREIADLYAYLKELR